jgi:hypothetical protein
MGLMSAKVSLKDIDQLDVALADILKAVDQRLEDTAEVVEREAKTTSSFTDKGGKLRKSISKQKSKFEDGGWIVVARAPHAHLVEYGHVKFLWGRPTGERVAPRPFLRPALEKGIRYAVAKFKESVE